jgi:hypothetical protein
MKRGAARGPSDELRTQQAELDRLVAGHRSGLAPADRLRTDPEVITNRYRYQMLEQRWHLLLPARTFEQKQEQASLEREMDDVQHELAALARMYGVN